MIPRDDRGFTLGDGVFETVLAEGGQLVALDGHLARLARSAALLGLPAPEAAGCIEAADRALAEAGLGESRAAVRLSWSAGSGGRGLDRPGPLKPWLVITAAPAPRPTGPARLHISTVRRNETSPASRAKTLAYLDNVLARREALAAGADEAVMLNTQGALACAAAANLFWIERGRLFTPALSCGVLDGVVRAQVLAAAPALGLQVAEIMAGPDALDRAEAVFLTNSLIRLRPALHAQADPAHPMLGRLAAAAEPQPV